MTNKCYCSIKNKFLYYFKVEQITILCDINMTLLAVHSDIKSYASK